jgi:hypothetical protein
MSGPITCGYILIHGSLLLTARALQEARAMRQEYGSVLARLRARQDEMAEQRRAQRNARLERLMALHTAADRQAARLERMRAAARSLQAQAPTLGRDLPEVSAPPPKDADAAAWSAHLASLNAAIEFLQARLAEASGAMDLKVRTALAGRESDRSIDDVLSAYLGERGTRAGLAAGDAEVFRETAARVLARLELPSGTALPADLEKLARDIVLSPTVERAEALASEMRLAVQRHREADARRRSGAEEAQRLLLELPDGAPGPLLRALECVAAGVESLDDSLRQAAQDALDQAAADREQAEQQAAAIVLEESLRDLGYDVEPIDATLFVDGGTVHFRRAGWENYFVRLRVAPEQRSVNFNVVRARGDEETDERRRLDALAEDRWCAEFPHLLQTLEARGLALAVKRRLEAGEVPVQVVDPGALPQRAPEEDAPPRAPPRARDLR